MEQAGIVYLSFIVRMWYVPASDDSGGAWRGEVEHIQSGRRWHFRHLEEMLALLARPEALLDLGAGGGDPVM